MEILRDRSGEAAIAAAVFDFDGTLSTLRTGWGGVMEPLMLEVIAGGEAPGPALRETVRAYIAESAGVQTAYQMQWLKERADEAGHGGPEKDLWHYKDLYNERLLAMVAQRANAVAKGAVPGDAYLLPGSLAFLTALRDRGVALYIASGTDDADLHREMALLGVAPLVAEAKGAPPRAMHCSKETIIDDLLKDLPRERLAVIGDGKVEIALGHAAGARTIGLATEDPAGLPINPEKRARLIAAGADAIVGDFEEKDALLSFFGFR